MPLLTTFSSPLICSLCASNDISILINNAKLFFDVTVNQIDCYTNDSYAHQLLLGDRFFQRLRPDCENSTYFSKKYCFQGNDWVSYLQSLQREA